MCDGWFAGVCIWHFQKMCMLPSWSSLMFSRALMTCRSQTHLDVEFLSHELEHAIKEAMIDGWLAGFSAWHFQKLCMMPSWSFLMFSRALLTMTFTKAFSCRVSVASAGNCKQRSNDSSLVEPFFSKTYPDTLFSLIKICWRIRVLNCYQTFTVLVCWLSVWLVWFVCDHFPSFARLLFYCYFAE